MSNALRHQQSRFLTQYHVIACYRMYVQVSELRSRAVYDDRSQEWQLGACTVEQEYVAPASVLVGSQRAISKMAKLKACTDPSPRYKHHNILQVELDMPERTTMDYEDPIISPVWQVSQHNHSRSESA